MSECEYCDFSHWGGKEFPPENPMLTVYMTKNILSISSDYKGRPLAMCFKINYCPMCGRKLEESK